MKSKLLQSVLMVILIIAFAFTGCKKEDEETNYLQIGDTTITLSDGGLNYYGDYRSSGTYNFDIYLFSPDVTITEASGEWDYSEEGTYVYFETYCNSQTELTDGSYSFLDNDTYPAFTFDYGEYELDMYIETGWVELVTGTLKVKKTDNGYRFDFTGTDEEGNAVKLNYIGSMHYEDSSSSAKKK